MSHFTPQQLQKDALKIAEFFVGSAAVSAQVVLGTLIAYIYW